jgi:hypothetical protein
MISSPIADAVTVAIAIPMRELRISPASSIWGKKKKMEWKVGFEVINRSGSFMILVNGWRWLNV